MNQDESTTIENNAVLTGMINDMVKEFITTNPDALELQKQMRECDERKQKLFERCHELACQYCVNQITTRMKASTNENRQQKGDDE